MKGLVLGVGHCTVDYLALVPRYPDQAESAEIAEFSQQGGGAAATALATAAIFGASTRFVGKIADDHFGRFITKGLEGLGVDIEQVIIEPERVSPFSFATVEMSQGRPTVFWSRGSVSPLTADEIDVDAALADADAVLIDGMHLDAQLAIARAAKPAGVPVVVDGATADDRLVELIRLSDTLIASERLATEIAPASELEQNLTELRKLGPRRCIITLGREGAVGMDEEGKVHEESAYDVAVKDNTGAGDVYLGAYTYAMLQGWSLPKAMRFAGVAAALTCQRLGARAGIPELPKVLEASGVETA